MLTLKAFKQEYEDEMFKLLFIKWFCKQNNWANKYMYILIDLFGRKFSTLDIPLKSSRSYELVKDWEQKGLIKIVDYMSKAKKYVFTTTLFAKAIEKQSVDNEVKELLLEKLDELII